MTDDPRKTPDYDFSTPDAKAISEYEGKIYTMLSEMNAPFDDPNFLFGLMALGYHSSIVGGIPDAAIQAFSKGLRNIQSQVGSEHGPDSGKGN